MGKPIDIIRIGLQNISLPDNWHDTLQQYDMLLGIQFLFIYYARHALLKWPEQKSKSGEKLNISPICICRYTLRRYKSCHWGCTFSKGKLLSILGANMYISGANM